jgi:hypothetical protein
MMPHITRGLRVLKRHVKYSFAGFTQYAGNAQEICTAVVDNCWNGEYFMTSTGHFREFWTRDFGLCSDALVRLGHRIKVIKTLDYALAVFQKKGHVTTTVSKRVASNFPYYAADSLPFLIRSLKNAKASLLIIKYKAFLEKEIDYYFTKVFDPKINMVYKNKHFSSMKDYAKRQSATYDNSMMYMLAVDLDTLGLYNPFSSYKKKIQKAIKKELWNGKYFYDDFSKKKVVTGDAQVFPFWCGVFHVRSRMFASCLRVIQKEGLDMPFPLKYTAKRTAASKMHAIDKVMGTYERNTLWMHLGLCYLDVIRKHNKKLLQEYLGHYTEQIEKHKTFLELYDETGKAFKNRVYVTDEGMLWASKYLELV